MDNFRRRLSVKKITQTGTYTYTEIDPNTFILSSVLNGNLDFSFTYRIRNYHNWAFVLNQDSDSRNIGTENFSYSNIIVTSYSDGSSTENIAGPYDVENDLKFHYSFHQPYSDATESQIHEYSEDGVNWSLTQTINLFTVDYSSSASVYFTGTAHMINQTQAVCTLTYDSNLTTNSGTYGQWFNNSIYKKYFQNMVIQITQTHDTDDYIQADVHITNSYN